MLSLQKINKIKVKPVKLPKVDTEDIKGAELFPELYTNVFLLAKKRSGKTSTIFKILKECSNKNTQIIIFASTVHKDPTYIAMKKYFKDKGMIIHTYTHFIQKGLNIIEELIYELQQDNIDSEDESDEEAPQKGSGVNFGDESDEEEEEYEYKPKKLAPELIIVLDDLSVSLRDESVDALLKTNRHWKSKVIISSQNYQDLNVPARQQLDFCLLFGHIPIPKLLAFHKDVDLSTSFETFKELYDNATKEKYHFLYVSIREDLFRKDFNYQYKIE